MNANARETRKVIEALSEEEAKEAVKGFDSDILAEELWSRLHFFEEKNSKFVDLVSRRR